MNMFGALSEISDKFIISFNVFSYMILQFRLKTVWKISKLYCMTLWFHCYALKIIACTAKVRDETGKNYEDKAKCLLSPLQSMGELFS